MCVCVVLCSRLSAADAVLKFQQVLFQRCPRTSSEVKRNLGQCECSASNDLLTRCLDWSIMVVVVQMQMALALSRSLLAARTHRESVDVV